MIVRYISVVIFLCVSLLAYSDENPIFILLDFQNGQQVVYLDGKIIKKENLYSELMKPLQIKGRKNKLNVVFNSKLSFSKVINIKGLIQAVGFDNIKFYYLSDDKSKMAEIEMNKPAVMVPSNVK